MERLFALSGLLVLPFWFLMIVLPRWRVTTKIIASPFIAAGPILLYAALVLPAIGEILPVVAQPRLDSVSTLLGQPLGTTAGWAHFLAFDLFVGRFIYLDARQRRLSALMISPLLLATLLLGPLGLGGYLLLRGNTLSRARLLASAFLRKITTGNQSLFWLAVGSSALFLVTSLLAWFDPRQVLGVSTWAKPAKFSIAVALAAVTLSFIVSHLDEQRRGMRRAIGVVTVTAVIELIAITWQAGRGVPSHFNNRTVVDLALFQVMGGAITAFWVAQLYLFVQTMRHRFDDALLGWGMRMGLLAALLGGAQGFLMPRPTPGQLQVLAQGERPAQIGAHSVGAEDGGPGMPVTGWNRNAGDLRVAHFVGLHGLQALPLLAFAIGLLVRRRDDEEESQTRALATGFGLFWLGTGGLFALMTTSLLQAMAGRPLASMDASALGAGGVVFLGFAVVGAVAFVRRGGLGAAASPSAGAAARA